MDIEDLQTFVEVAAAGGVSPAARRLGLAKSIVSRRILKLEDELRVQLVARTTRGATLTEAGRRFHEHAARVCVEMEAIRDVLAPQGDLRGILRVAAPASFGPVHLAPMFSELARKHPLLHVHTSYADRYVDLAREGFDCGIRVGYLPSSDLVARRIAELPVRLYASPAYLRAHGCPEAPGDIAAHPAILVADETWKLGDGARTTLVVARGRIKADSALAIAEAIAAGFGIGALGDIVAAPYVASGRMVPVLTAYQLPPVVMAVVRPPGPHPPRKVKVLTDLLAKHYGRRH